MTSTIVFLLYSQEVKHQFVRIDGKIQSEMIMVIWDGKNPSSHCANTSFLKTFEVAQVLLIKGKNH